MKADDKLDFFIYLLNHITALQASFFYYCRQSMQEIIGGRISSGVQEHCYSSLVNSFQNLGREYPAYDNSRNWKSAFLLWYVIKKIYRIIGVGLYCYIWISKNKPKVKYTLKNSYLKFRFCNSLIVWLLQGGLIR